MSTTEYRKFTYQGATFIVGTDGSVDGLRHYSLVGNGYMTLKRKVDGKQKHFLVHRIVAAAWLEPPLFPEQTQIDHIDGDKQNNRVENLRWVTPKENCKNRTRLCCRRVVAVNTKTGISYVATSPKDMHRKLGIHREPIVKYARLNRPYRNWLFIMNEALKSKGT
jgi:hypothetical protein